MSSEYFWTFVQHYFVLAIILAILTYFRRNGYTVKSAADTKAVIYVKDLVNFAIPMMKLILFGGVAVLVIVFIGFNIGEPIAAH